MLKSSRVRNASRSASASKRSLRVESLEHKAMLAGDVAAAVIDGDLFLTGDAADNQFEIVRDVTQVAPGAGEVTIRGLLGTTINGLSEVTFNGADAVTSDVEIDLTAGGFDEVTIGEAGSASPLVFSDDLRISGGVSGGNLVTVANVDLAGDFDYTALSGGLSSTTVLVFDSSVGGGATVESQADDAVFALERAVVGADAELNAVGGISSFVDVFDTTIGNDLIYTANNTTAALTLSGATVTDDVVFNATGIDNEIDANEGALTIRNSIGDDFIFNGGAGVEELSIVATDIGDDLRIDVGDGLNVAEIFDITVGDDFVLEDGDNGEFFSEYQISDATIGDDVYVSANAGNDLIGFEFVTVGDNFRVSGGDGEDEVFLVDSTVNDSVLISLGRGFDQTEVENATIGRDLTVVSRDDNVLFFRNVVATRSARVFTSGGLDEILFENVDTHFALISTSAGNDIVSIGSSQITGQPPELSEIDLLFVFLGAGDDSLTLDGVDADFALLSGGSGTDTLVDAEDANDITFAIDFAFEDFPIA